LLYIPLEIDDYNHHMNGADIANQRRKYCSNQRKHNIRAWRLLFLWLLDIVIANCYILWREHTAAMDGHEAVVQLPFDRGAEITVVDEERWTALHIAAMNGHEAVVQLLLDRGADVNATTNSRATALDFTAEMGRSQLSSSF
jgi:ankyrin repeat protein